MLANTSVISVDEVNAKVAEMGITDIEYLGTSLNLTTYTKVRHVFTVKTGTVEAAITKYKNRFAMTDASVGVKVVKSSSTSFAVESDGIPAAYLLDAEKYGICLDNETLISEYSILNYGKKAAIDNNVNRLNAVKALYYYSMETNILFS